MREPNMATPGTIRQRTRTVLIVLILATLPCYLLGFIVLGIAREIRSQKTPVPTAQMEFSPTAELPVENTKSLPVPTLVFPTKTETLTPTISLTPTITATFELPPSQTPSPTYTETPEPSPTPTLTLPPAETSASTEPSG